MDEIGSVSSKVSKMTFGDETAATGASFKTNHTGFKSILYKRERAAESNASQSRKRKKSVYGATSLSLPFVIDTWSSKKARMSCSVQVMCLGTKSPKDTHFFRVSTDRCFLVLKIEVSENALNEQKAFYRAINRLFPDQREMLEYHTKFAARKMSVGKLTGRDNSKRVEIEQRIPLPFACEHDFATKDNDPFFYGVRYVPYPDSGEVWAHVELVQHIKDGYVGRDGRAGAYLGSIEEDDGNSEKENEVQENGGEYAEMDYDDEDSLLDGEGNGRDNASVATSVLLTESAQMAAAVQKQKALAVTPQKPDPPAAYPRVLTDSEIRKLRCNRSVCSNITAAGRMVSHTPPYTPPKSSSASYDGRIQRDNVKRMAKYQG